MCFDQHYYNTHYSRGQTIAEAKHFDCCISLKLEKAKRQNEERCQNPTSFEPQAEQEIRNKNRVIFKNAKGIKVKEEMPFFSVAMLWNCSLAPFQN